jgi:V/A-type H+-transporting ATPase subunit K
VKRRGAMLVLVLMALYVVSFTAMAAAQEAGKAGGLGIGPGLMGVGAGIAIGFGAVGTGIAQSRIGGAAAGVVAERPEMFGIMLVLLVIPETLVIFGFVIAFFLYGKI